MQIEEAKLKMSGTQWLLIILLAVIMNLASSTITIMQTPGLVRVFTIGPYGEWMFMPAPFLLLGIVLFFSRIGKFKSLTSQTLGLIYITTVMSIGFGYELFPWRQLGFIAIYPRLTANSKWLPLMMCPSAEVTNKILLGGMAVPWAEWAIPIIYWIVHFSLLLLFVLSLANILRRLWIDIEMLPYPYAEAAAQLIRPIRDLEAEVAGVRVKRITLGIALAIILYTPYILNRLFAWFPDIYGWTNFNYYISWLAGSLDLVKSTRSLADSIIGLTALNWNFVYFAIGLLIPINILQSFTIAWIIFGVILPQVAYTMGAYSGITSLGDGTLRVGTMCWNPPLNYESFNSLGILPGILVMGLIVNWRYFARVFKAAKDGSPRDGEPLTYRSSLILVVVSWILLIALFLASNISILPAVVLSIFLAIYVLAFARLHGLNVITGVSMNYSPGFFHWMWPGRTMETVTQEYVLVNVWADLWGMPQYAPTGAILFMFDSYKMATITKLDNRICFQVILLSSIISITISVLLYIVVGYTFGLSKIPFTGGGGWDLFSVGLPSFVNAKPSPFEWWPWALAGFLTAAALTILSQRFVWWPLHPVGVYIATSQPLWMGGWWSIFVTSFVLKTAIVRTGGTKTYEEWVVPIITGFLVGYTLTSVVGGIVGAYRFFVPF